MEIDEKGQGSRLLLDFKFHWRVITWVYLDFLKWLNDFLNLKLDATDNPFGRNLSFTLNSCALSI